MKELTKYRRKARYEVMTPPPVSVDWRWSRCVSGRNQMTRRTRDATYNNGKHSLNWCGPCAQEEPSRGPVLAELSGPQIHVAFKAKRSSNALPPGYKTVSTNHPFRVFMCLKYAPHLKKKTCAVIEKIYLVPLTTPSLSPVQLCSILYFWNAELFAPRLLKRHFNQQKIKAFDLQGES